MEYGTYKITRTDVDGSVYTQYLYHREKGSLMLTYDEDRASMTFTDRPITEYIETFDKCENISINRFYEVYRKVLKKTDELLGKRGVLIKPSELNSRLTIDHRDRIQIKY